MNYTEVITCLQAEVAELQAAIRVLGKLNKPEESPKDPDKPKQIRTKRAKAEKSGNGTRECSKCGKTRAPDEYPKKGNVCRECVRTYQREWVRKNYNTKSGPLPFACEECHAKFSSKAALDTHMEVKHGDD